jgi:glycosyltransferase involved in cell wall biosynthesis
MAEAMLQLGHDPVIAGYYNDTNYPTQQIEVHRFPKPPVMHRNILTINAGAVQTWFRVRHIPDIQLVHLRDYLHGGIFAWLGGLPVVVTPAGNVYERIQRGIPYFDRVTRQFYKWSARTVSRRAKRVIAHSSEQRDWWLFTGTSPLQIVQIPLGVDETIFYPVPDARQQLGLDRGAKIILFASRLYWHLKGLDLLLQIFQQVHKAIPDVKLVVAGDGPDHQLFEACIAARELRQNVKILNWISPPEMLLWYNAADVCVLTSRSEAFSRVMLEAMACGTPFIGSPHGGMRDNIVNGQTGYVVDPEATEHYAQVLIRLLQDDTQRSEIGLNALNFVRRHFSWKGVMQRVCDEVYAPILCDKSPYGTYFNEHSYAGSETFNLMER